MTFARLNIIYTAALTVSCFALAACNSGQESKMIAFKELQIKCKIDNSVLNVKKAKQAIMKSDVGKVLYIGNISESSFDSHGKCIRHFKSMSGYKFQFGLNRTVV